jgi:predicted permease
VGGLWQDVRFGLRMLAKNPGFTAVAVLTLALGIGANAAIFSILDPLLLRKLPVQNPDELVLVHSAGSMESVDGSETSAFVLYRDNNNVFSNVIADGGMTEYQITLNGHTSAAQGDAVSGSFFPVLGVRPFAGRLLAPDDDHNSSGNPVVVLSFDYWKSMFGADPSAIGKTIPILNVPYTIVGVTPPEFFGVKVGNAPDFYLPLGNPPKAAWVNVLVRLKPGVSIAQAQAGLEPLFKQVVAQSNVPVIEQSGGMARLVLTPAARGLSDLREKFSLPARILMAVVGLVLLIACSNVANLLFARGAARRKEITVRLALGAGRWRLVRQLLTESTLLVVLGAAVGLLVANWASNWLLASLSTAHLHVALTAGLSGRVLLFTAAVLLLTVLLCGLTPALSSTRAHLGQDLKVQAGPSTTSSRSRTGRLIIVAQVALSMTILAGAGLLLHSLFNLETFNVGFNRDNVLAITFNGAAAGRTADQASTFYERLVEQARNFPGVRSAGFSSYSQTSGMMGINVVLEGRPASPGQESHVFFNYVTPQYFETLGIPLLRGRDFTSQDNGNAPYVAVINETMARHYFGDQSPLGKRFNLVGGITWPLMEIVGVVADSKYNDLREQTPDFVYANRTQMQAFRPSPRVAGVLDVRVNGNPKFLIGPLRDAIHSFDSTVKITSVKTLREQIDESLHQDRLIAALCGIFSLLALTLTCIGLYGTLSFSVARRTNEIGIRMALGARPRDIFRLVIGQGMRMVTAGLVLGAAGALASASVLSGLLFGVKGADPVTFAGVSLLLIAAAILACYLPARRAMRVDPLVALRYE